MPLKIIQTLTRERIQAEPTALFVFGDNLAKFVLGGQAKAARGEPNAFGIPTKRSPQEFMQDSDLALVVPSLLTIEWALATEKTVYWPYAGVGTGLAQLERHAPMIRILIDAAFSRWQSMYGT